MGKASLLLILCLLPVAAFAAVPFDPPHEGAPVEVPEEVILPSEKAEDEAREDVQHKAAAEQESYRKRLETARGEANAEIGACKEKYLQGKYKTHVQMVTCFNRKISSYFIAAGYPYPDLLRALSEKRLSVAHMIDKKTMSEQQGEAEIAAFEKSMADEEVRRHAKGIGATRAKPDAN